MAGGGLHRVRHGLVGIAKRQAFFHQIVGEVGGGGKAFFGRVFHGLGIHPDAALFGAGGRVHLAAHHLGKDAQRVFQGVHRVKQRLFVFLVVFVVGQRLAFHQGDQTHQMADHTTGFAPRQFGHIGVFLLRHDGRTRGEAVCQLDESKVLAHPNDQLFRQAADVHHAQRGGGGELDGEVAVAHRVQAVLAQLRLTLGVDHAQGGGDTGAVQGVSGAGQRR